MKVKPMNSAKGWRGMLAKVTYRQWLLIAAAASCLLGILVYIWLPGGESQPVPFQQSPVIKVVRAAQDIPERTEITESMLEVLDVPEDMVPAGALRRTAEVLGKTAGIAIMKGDILTSRKLMESQMAGFVGSIPADCRAVSVGVSDVTGVAGFARPGDHVDVMVISGKRNDNTVQGKLFLQDVLLLAINSVDAKADAKGDGSESSVGSPATATLALLPTQALKLATVSQEGKIYLALRPYRPTEAVVLDTGYVSLVDSAAARSQTQTAAPAPVQRQTQPAPAAAPAAPVAAPAAQGGNYGIQIFRGPGTRSEAK